MDPPASVVDARIPHPRDDAARLLGIDQLVIEAPGDTWVNCWSLCESRQNPQLHPAYPPALQVNEVVEVVHEADGTQRLVLRRPITPGEVTIVTYEDGLGGRRSARFVALPGDADGNGGVFPSDILALVDMINGTLPMPWGMYSADIDGDGMLRAADILVLVNLMNGLGEFEHWGGARVNGKDTSCSEAGE